MEFWIFIVTAVLVITIVPYIRLFFKRISLAVRIRRACRENHFIFRPAHPFWLFGWNNSGHCDFYCISEKDSRMYSVKLFASLFRLADLTFFDDRKYRTKRYFALGGRGKGYGDSIVWKKESRIKKLCETDWYHGIEDDYTHRCVPVLLVNPVPMKVYRSKIVPLKQLERGYAFAGKEETTVANTQVYDGDFIYDAYLFSASSFARELDHSCIF